MTFQNKNKALISSKPANKCPVNLKRVLTDLFKFLFNVNFSGAGEFKSKFKYLAHCGPVQVPYTSSICMESHLGFYSSFPDIGKYFPISGIKIPDIGKQFPDNWNSNFGYREIWNYFLISGIQFPDIRK